MKAENETAAVGQDHGGKQNQATPDYHPTLEDATAWALDIIAKSGTNVEWLRKATVPMFLRDKTPDEQKLLERVVMLEDGLRRLVNQADLGRPDLLDFYVRTIAAELGVR